MQARGVESAAGRTGTGGPDCPDRFRWVHNHAKLRVDRLILVDSPFISGFASSRTRGGPPSFLLSPLGVAHGHCAVAVPGREQRSPARPHLTPGGGPPLRGPVTIVRTSRPSRGSQMCIVPSRPAEASRSRPRDPHRAQPVHPAAVTGEGGHPRASVLQIPEPDDPVPAAGRQQGPAVDVDLAQRTDPGARVREDRRPLCPRALPGPRGGSPCGARSTPRVTGRRP